MLINPYLKNKVDSLWDKFLCGGISNPLTTIEQMSHLIFLNRLENIDNARAASAKRNEMKWKRNVVTEIFDFLSGFVFKGKEYSTDNNDIKICGGLIVYPGRIEWEMVILWSKLKTKGLGYRAAVVPYQ